MHTYLMEMLECPVCHGTLQWDVLEEEGDRIETGIAKCKACSTSYPINENIAVFLPPDNKRNDLWEKDDNQLMLFLKEHPDQKRMLMNMPVETLEPGEQHLLWGKFGPNQTLNIKEYFIMDFNGFTDMEY